MSTLICPKCSYKTDENEQFCCKCGTMLAVVPEKAFCSSCGAELKSDAEFCSQCGVGQNSSKNNTCSKCGAALESGEQFCSKCGTETKGFLATNEDSNLETMYQKALDDYLHERHVSAFDLFKKAAEQGYPKAQFYLAHFYQNGLCVPLDEDEASKWYNMAEKQGINSGTIDDRREVLLRKAERGDAYAQYKLGCDICLHCFSSESEFKEDEKWLSRATSQGYAQAQFILARCYVRMSDQKYFFWNKNKLREKAFELWSEAAEHGHAGALWALGYFYLWGKVVKKNEITAFKWYRQAYEAGYRERRIFSVIGFCHAAGFGTVKDKEEAAKWYKKAIEHGDELAEEKLKWLGQ